MKLKTLLRCGTMVVAGTVWCIASEAWAQVAPEAATAAAVAAQNKPEEQLVTKVYPVADLVFSAPNYPFEGLDAGMFGTVKKNQPMGGGFGGGGGGFGGGGFGGGGFAVPPEGGQPSGKQPRAAPPTTGGGMFGAPAVNPVPGTPSIGQLIDVIENLIHSQTFDREGGQGTIAPFGGRLIITQTPEIHVAIHELLNALRNTQGGAQSTVTIRAWWLRLDNAQYQKLVADPRPSSPPAVDRKQLEQLASEKSADSGQVTCFDGQTVHIISGRFRNAITSVIPVVGQADPQPQPLDYKGVENALAAVDSPQTDRIVAQLVSAPKEHNPASLAGTQLAAADEPQTLPGGKTIPSEGIVGYQPVTTTQHAGAMLEVTPTRLPESRAIILDLRSVVNRWDTQPEKPIEFRNSMPLDRTNVVSQQLSTTVKVPVRTPVLVGGLSLQPGAANDADSKSQLYLVIEAFDESK